MERRAAWRDGTLYGRCNEAKAKGSRPLTDPVTISRDELEAYQALEHVVATVLSLHVVDETQQDALVTAVAACRAARRVSGRKVEGVIAGETKVEELRRRRRNQRRLIDLIDDLVGTFDRRSAFSTQRLEQELARRKPLADIAPRYRPMMLEAALRFLARRGRVARLEGKGGGWRVAGEALRDQRGCRVPEPPAATAPAS